MKRRKEYFDCHDMKFILESPDEVKCFGCNSKINAGNPRFFFYIHENKTFLCPKCALLTRMKNASIRRNEFDNHMANAHKKNLKKAIEQGMKNTLVSFFPEFHKVNLISEEQL